MNDMSNFAATSGRLVGHANYYTECGAVVEAGDVFRDDAGWFELSVAHLPNSGVLDLYFDEDVGEGSREIAMLVHARHGNCRFELGRVRLEGLTGRAIFFGNPVTEARFVF